MLSLFSFSAFSNGLRHCRCSTSPLCGLGVMHLRFFAQLVPTAVAPTAFFSFR